MQINSQPVIILESRNWAKIKDLNEHFKKSIHTCGLSYLWRSQGLRGVLDVPGLRGRDPSQQRGSNFYTKMSVSESEWLRHRHEYKCDAKKRDQVTSTNAHASMTWRGLWTGYGTRYIQL